MEPTSFIWISAPGSPVAQTLTLDAGWLGAIYVRAYYEQGGDPLPEVQQPTFSQQGNNLMVALSGVQTKTLWASTWIEVRTGSDLRFAGTLSLNYTAPGTIAPTIPISSILGLPDQLATISSLLAQIRAGTMGSVNTISMQQTAAQATGSDKKIIWETIGNKSNMWRYDPNAQVPKELIFTSDVPQP